MPALTSLRFVAALWVVLFHFGASTVAATSAPTLVKAVLQQGYLGVSFFFILSGFVLTAVYRNGMKTPADRRRYGAARFARVYPVYILCLLLAVPLDWPLGLKSLVLAPALLQSWTSAASGLGLEWNNPSWTLSVELFFYLAFVPLCPLIRRLGNPSLCGLGVLMAAVAIVTRAAGIAPGQAGSPAFAAVPLPMLHLSQFIFGCVLAEGVARASGVRRAVWTDLLLAASAGAGLLVVGFTDLASALAPLIFGAVIVLAAVSVGPIGRLLSAKVFVFLGASSYALYLLQHVVNGYFDRAFGDSMLGRLLMPVALVAIAALVYRYFEEPVRARLKVLSTRRVSSRTTTG